MSQLVWRGVTLDYKETRGKPSWEAIISLPPVSLRLCVISPKTETGSFSAVVGTEVGYGSTPREALDKAFDGYAKRTQHASDALTARLFWCNDRQLFD